MRFPYLSRSASSMRREALKKAVPDRLPNLLLTRLEKQQKARQLQQRVPWIALALFVIFTGLLLLVTEKDFLKLKRSAPPPPAPAPRENAAPSADVSPPEPAVPARESDVPAPESAVPAREPASAAQWKGFFCGVKDFREVVIRDGTEWQNLWKEIGQDGPAPAVNFADSMIVGIFLGEKPRGYDVVLDSPEEGDSRVTLPYRVGEPASPTGRPASEAAPGGPPAQPFHLKVIPRSEKTIRFRPRRAR